MDADACPSVRTQSGRDGVAASPGLDPRLGMDAVEGGRTALDNKTSLLNTPSPRSFAGPRGREYNPYSYGDTISAYDKSALKEAVFDDDVEQFRDGEAAAFLGHPVPHPSTSSLALPPFVHCFFSIV